MNDPLLTTLYNFLPLLGIFWQEGFGQPKQNQSANAGSFETDLVVHAPAGHLIWIRFCWMLSGFLAVRRGKKKVGIPEFEEAVERVVTGLEKKNRLIDSKERKIVAYQEMGHAIVANSLPGTDPVRKISIIPRGIAALGYTLQTPTEDRFLMTKSELPNRIATLLGGGLAEEIVFEDISTRVHNDLARATDIARSTVKEYSMSSKVGQTNPYE